MVEANRSPRKRKLFSPSFNRCKSHIRISKSDSILLDIPPHKKSTAQPLPPSPLSDTPHAVAVKDLRTRRVYSPISVREEKDVLDGPGNKFSKEFMEQSTPPDMEFFPNLAENRSTKSTENGAPCIRSKTKSVLNPYSKLILSKTPTSFSYRRLLPYLMDIDNRDLAVDKSVDNDTMSNELKPMNLKPISIASDDPNGVSLGAYHVLCPSFSRDMKHDSSTAAQYTDKELRSIFGSSGSREKNEKPQSVEQIDLSNAAATDLNIPLNEFQGTSNVHDHIKVQSSPKSKLVINPCSRLKLFKAPGSFSYKRLLPYLMDVAKKDPCPSSHDLVENITSQTLVPQTKEGNNSQSLVTSNNDSPELLIPGHLSKSPQKEKYTKVSCLVSDTADAYLETTSEAGNDTPGLLIPEHLSKSQDPQKEQDTKVSCIVSDTVDANLESTNEACTREVIGLAVETKEDCQNPTPEAGNCVQGNMPVTQKGILKRTTGGRCRGLCSCLKCSSFRLHAERAFEFSRNQMQDAEEMVSDLVKELCYLKNLLEKSPTTQIKEACKKASEAEEVAKERLRQMNYDLQGHCSIPCERQATVRFADNVEEKTIERDLS